jgi:cysteine sulfinate desulfinase/cysteine desulfurase-like protein
VCISAIYANNETDNLSPVKEIARVAKGKEIIFHTDALLDN